MFFETGLFPYGEAWGKGGYRTACPDSGSELVLRPIPLKTSETLDRTPILYASSATRSSDRFLASVAVPAHLRRVPSQRLLTSGTSVILESSGLSPPENQIAKQKADGCADCDSDQARDECWRDCTVSELLSCARVLCSCQRVLYRPGIIHNVVQVFCQDNILVSRGNVSGVE